MDWENSITAPLLPHEKQNYRRPVKRCTRRGSFLSAAALSLHQLLALASNTAEKSWLQASGNIFDEGYRGTNSLIKQGAKLIDGIEDIIIALRFSGLTFKMDKHVDLDNNERYIYGIIGVHKDSCWWSG